MSSGTKYFFNVAHVRVSLWIQPSFELAGILTTGPKLPFTEQWSISTESQSFWYVSVFPLIHVTYLFLHLWAHKTLNEQTNALIRYIYVCHSLCLDISHSLQLHFYLYSFSLLLNFSVSSTTLFLLISRKILVHLWYFSWPFMKYFPLRYYVQVDMPYPLQPLTCSLPLVQSSNP